MAHYLILEDNDEYFEQVYETAFRDKRGQEDEFTYYRAKTVDEAHIELARARFTCAIVDLHLVSGGKADGNDVAKKIHSDYLMPVAIVTGFEDELEAGLKELAAKSCFFKLFKKSGKISDVFDFINIGAKSGVLQMLGPGGEFTKMISDIFWNHLGGVINNCLHRTLEIEDKRRILRHAVSHMIGALLSKDNGDWDTFLHEEVYIWPTICNKEATGHIYEGIPADGEENGFFLLVTPLCDIVSVKMEYRHFVQILPFNKFHSNRYDNMVGKKEFRYHVLPPTSFFNGGVVDFAALRTFRSDIIATRFTCKGSLIEPYWRELVNRLGVWMTRQGTPDFDKSVLLTEIRQQCPQPTETVVTPK